MATRLVLNAVHFEQFRIDFLDQVELNLVQELFILEQILTLLKLSLPEPIGRDPKLLCQLQS